MRLIAGYVLTVLLAVASCAASAQSTSSAIHGKIRAENSAPAEAATVVILKAQDSSVVKGTISGKDGGFNFNGLQAGSYLIFITKLNYDKLYAGPYQLAEGKDLDAGAVNLKVSTTKLKEVQITGKKDYVEVKADRTILNVDQNINAAGNSVYDVLSTSPGVKVNNGEILYRGGQRALIAIDGKPVLLTGDELVNFLKNYQSTSISQIELIDNPGSKYEAAASGGMINIVLKRNKSLGSNFGISQTAGFEDDYKFSTNLTYTLRTEKLNLFASYGFQDSKTPHTISNDRQVNTGGQLYNFDLDYIAHLKAVNNNFNVGADYQLAKGQTIGFLINGFYNHTPIDKRNTTAITIDGEPNSGINTYSSINRNISNMSYDVNYKGNLDKDGHSVLSGNADYADYHRHSDEALQNDFFNASGQPDSSIFYKDSSPSHITIRSANLDFVQRVSDVIQFNAGAKSSRVNSSNSISFNQPVYGADLNNNFTYGERVDAAYFGFDGKFNKTSISVNLRDEHTTSNALSVNPNKQVDSSYNDLFPNIQIGQQLDKDNLLTFFYRRSIHRPDYQDLNPFVAYVDQFYYNTGNPFLKPEYLNTYELSDLIKDKYKIGLMMIVTDRFFNYIFEQDDATRVYTSTKANLGTHYQYQLEFNLPVDITPWWNVSADIDIFHEKYAYTLDTVRAKNTNGFNIYLHQTFKLSPRLSLQLYDQYESSSYYIISQYQPLFFMNAGISYSILHNKGSIRLLASDLFNTDYNKYHTTYANLNITERDQLSAHMITATFSYHFGSSTPKARSNSTEEQKRLGGGNDE
jgi:iron complex outermembrane receptor protein